MEEKEGNAVYRSVKTIFPHNKELSLGVGRSFSVFWGVVGGGLFR